MALRKILTIPDSILRQKSLPVDKVNKEIKPLYSSRVFLGVGFIPHVG